MEDDPLLGTCSQLELAAAAVADAQHVKPEKIDLPMAGTMVVYSGTFLGFFWRVIPVTFGISCHVFNIAAQGNQIRRATEYKIENGKEEAETLPLLRPLLLYWQVSFPCLVELLPNDSARDAFYHTENR